MGTNARELRTFVDIGSTVVKIARVGVDDEIVDQEFQPRDHELGIARQVGALLSGIAGPRICSSANGGLRVGIVCLTTGFSGAVLRNQALLAGANPVFVRAIESEEDAPEPVDVLLMGGGIDCEDAAPLATRLRSFDSSRYRFGALVYAGNRHLADVVRESNPEAVVVPNPIGEGLRPHRESVFETLRRAYLDDLVHKAGVSELGAQLAAGIRPTPEVVNRGFLRAVTNRSGIRTAAPCLLFDIGGATTDIHYTAEIVRSDSETALPAGTSVARYVFTDLGISASRDSTLLQLRTHPRSYEFLCVVLEDARAAYGPLREEEYDPSPEVLSYACFFLALDRFCSGRGPGLPTADPRRIAQILLTGGASQGLEESKLKRLVGLFRPASAGVPAVEVDRSYRIWVDGLSWSEEG